MKLYFDELGNLKDSDFFRQKIEDFVSYFNEKGMAINLESQPLLAPLTYENDTLTFEVSVSIPGKNALQKEPEPPNSFLSAFKAAVAG